MKGITDTISKGSNKGTGIVLPEDGGTGGGTSTSRFAWWMERNTQTEYLISLKLIDFREGTYQKMVAMAAAVMAVAMAAVMAAVMAAAEQLEIYLV